MTTLTDIVNFIQTPIDELGAQEAWDSYTKGVAQRATPQGFGESLAENLSMDPRTGDFGVVGAGSIHGMKSNLFPDDWKGTNGKAWKMLDEGHTPTEIARKSYEETGMMIWPQHLYENGKFKRTDWMMDVPPIGLKGGKVGIDDIANYSTADNLMPKDISGDDILTDLAYPGMLDNTNVQVTNKELMDPALMTVLPGKYGRRNLIKINEEIGDVEESLLPKFEHEKQHLIGEQEGFSPGGPAFDPNHQKLGGEVYARAVENQMETIFEQRAKGMSDKEIRDYLVYDNPIFKNFDVKDIFQVHNKRGAQPIEQAATPDSSVATHQIESTPSRRTGEISPLAVTAKAGGHPSPSIGISTVRNQGDRSYYGDTNLVGPKELMIPGKDFDVFADDAYTSTHPEFMDKPPKTLDEIANIMTTTEQNTKLGNMHYLTSMYNKGNSDLRTSLNDLMAATPKKLTSLDEVLTHSANIETPSNVNEMLLGAEFQLLQEAQKSGIPPTKLFEALAKHRLTNEPLPNNLHEINKLFDARSNEHGYLEAKPRRAVKLEEYSAAVAPPTQFDTVKKLMDPYGVKTIYGERLDSGKFSDSVWEELDKLNVLIDPKVK